MQRYKKILILFSFTRFFRIFADEFRKKGTKTMATAIKAIPTLYGNEARRFRDMADEVERRYEAASRKDREQNPFVISMREMLKRSGI